MNQIGCHGFSGTAALVINAVDAVRLLEIKHILRRRTSVSIHGKVTAISEIVRINKDCVFLVELEGSPTVVVKQPQFHKWHQQLENGRSFVFTNLRPTTLSKSYNPQQRVYVPWTDSQLLTDEVNTSCSFVTLQEWLNTHGLSLPLEDDEDVDADFCDDEAGVTASCSLISYQGVVTDISQSEFQIFGLDDMVRLYLCFLPKLQQPIRLEVGDLVTIFNVHQTVSPLTQEKRLFCCMKSSMHVRHKEAVKFSGGEKTHTARSERDLMSPPAPLLLLSQFAFTQHDVHPLLQLSADVSHVLGKRITQKSSKTKGGLRDVLHQLTSSVLCAPDGRRPRNYILEFCQHETFCPLSQLQGEMSEIPRLTLLNELTQQVMATKDGSLGAPCRPCLSTLDASGDEDVWQNQSQSITEKDKKPLLGWLTVNNATGHLQLTDAEEAVDVVISMASSTQMHQCNTSCDCSCVSQGEQLRCPLVHPCCLGHLIMVKKYTAVLETFDEKVFESNRDRGSSKVVYLLLSVEDCVVVQKKPKDPQKAVKKKSPSSDSKENGTFCHSPAAEEKNVKRLPETAESLVYVTSKHSLHACDIPLTRQTQLQFCAEGFTVMPEGAHAESQHASSATGNGNITQEETIPAKKAWKQKNNDRSELGCDSGKANGPSCSSSRSSTHTSAHSESMQSDCCTFQLGQPLYLTFCGPSCRWFDLLHPLGLYRFSSKEDSQPLQWVKMDQKLQQAMERAGTQTTVEVSPAASVDKVFDGCVNYQGAKLAIPSLLSALSDGSSRLWSFRAEVMWRRHPPPQMACFQTVGGTSRSSQKQLTNGRTLSSLLGQRSLCVGVRDRSDPSATASIYFNVAALAYPLGLLPGAVVDFHRLDRKTSKANKIYFSFLPVSGLTVVCGHEDSMSHTVPPSAASNQRISWEDTPTQFLVDLWREPHPFDMFVAGCHLCQFFRVSLKSVCVRCGSLFQPAGCSAPACTNKDQSNLLARISVLVEDGSSQVLVNINKHCPPDAARKLLLMSQDQWQHLETAVQHEGELFLQKFGCRGGTAVEDLLSLLCDSRRVKRPCWLMLRKPMWYSKKHTGQGGNITTALQALSADELVLRKINTGELTVETLCLPYVHLECVDVKEM